MAKKEETIDINEILLNYDVRREYEEFAEDLTEVYKLRVAHWESAGFKEGQRYIREIRSNLDVHRAVLTLQKKGGCGYVVNADLGEGAKRTWPPITLMLSFHPGAIIAASQDVKTSIAKGDPGALCCFGYGRNYEQTALQMAYDPNIAVLKVVDHKGRRKNGFQMVVLTAEGLTYYGAYYGSGRNGYFHDYEISEDIVHSVVNQLEGVCSSKEIRGTNIKIAEKSNRAFGSNVDDILRLLRHEGEEEPERELQKTDWEPLELKASYGDKVGKCVPLKSQTKTEELPYDSSRINGKITRSRIYEKPWRRCTHCNAPLWQEDREEGNFFGGEIVGLTGIYCKEDCLHADALKNSTDKFEHDDHINVVINGKIYQIPKDGENSDTDAQRAA